MRQIIMNLTSVFELRIAHSEVVVEKHSGGGDGDKTCQCEHFPQHEFVTRQSKVDVARPSGLGLCARGARVSTRLTLLPATRGQPRRRVAASTTWKHIAIHACRCLWAPGRVSGVPARGL